MIMCRCRRFTAEVLRGVNILWILRLIAQKQLSSVSMLVGGLFFCCFLVVDFFLIMRGFTLGVV